MGNEVRDENSWEEVTIQVPWGTIKGKTFPLMLVMKCPKHSNQL